MEVGRIGGLPAHPLFVHFVVALVPLTAVAAVSAVLSGRARRWLGPALPILAAVALALVPLTTGAGEWLVGNKRPSPRLAAHIEAGDKVVWAVAAMAVCCVLWWLLHREGIATMAGRWKRHAAVAVGSLLVVASVLSVAAVYRAGDTGAWMIWHNKPKPAAQTPGG